MHAREASANRGDALTYALVFLILALGFGALMLSGTPSGRVLLTEATLTPAPTLSSTPLPEAAAADEPPACTYILNTSSRRFHTPSCKSVTTIKDKNRAEFTGTREELIEQGYVPCGNCKP